MFLITGIDGYVNHPPSELMKKQFHFLSHSGGGHWWRHSPDTRYHWFKWPVWKICDRELGSCHLEGPWEDHCLVRNRSLFQRQTPISEQGNHILCAFLQGVGKWNWNKRQRLCIKKSFAAATAVFSTKKQPSLESWAANKQHTGFYVRCINSGYFSQLLRYNIPRSVL